MRPDDRILARKHLDKRLEPLRSSQALGRPPRGWLKAIREALGMTTSQLATRLGVSQPRAVDIEKSEIAGAVTLDTLERAARAMHCKLVYAFVPEKPLEQLIEERARMIAKKRLAITGHNMALEAQSISADDERAQYEALVRKIIEKAGSDLWKDER